MTRPTIHLVAAVARNGTIGKDNALPWHLPEDLRRFKQLTLGHAVLMGRKTWDSLPAAVRPLPGRRNIVLSRQPGWQADGALRATSMDDAVALAGADTALFVIGGAAVYAAALPVADALLLTELHADFDGDAAFPAWDRAAFGEAQREPRTAQDGLRYDFVCYRRRTAA